MYGINQNDPAYYEAYRQAQKRVKDRMGFYWHLATYVIVNGFLIAIYLLTSLADGGLYYPWFIWPLAGWGIGLLLNFLGVFVLVETPAAQQQRIAREMERMGYNPSAYSPAPPPTPTYTPAPPSATLPTYTPAPPPTTLPPYPTYDQTEADSTPDLAGRK
jgi:hypothetical protein